MTSEVVNALPGGPAQEKERAKSSTGRRSAVEALTISELAQVASTLVDLSSFEQQMSLDSETVGGPVDVAVISKGDGFIWINRKHYFRKELNDHFFRNYHDDEDKAGDNRTGGDEEDATDDE